MSAAEPRWRRLEPDERREQILACAIELFGERPYAGVSTTELAHRAGVARGLINHYFGTKRDLYLEVVRRMVTIPQLAVDRLPKGTLEERVDSSVTWFLDGISRHSKTWLAAIGAEGVDTEVARILAEADELAADRVLEATGLSDAVAHREELRALIRAYGGLVKATAREWLVRGALSRDQVQMVLATSLLSIVREMVPRIQSTED
ncbi:MAG: TetR family transcriptional regulator [Actinophytocola sp.]|uniref:TetR/AcrR family transcriptional regulator n=1 Tax=Actinophytocola sp. TaxID=1872138 RepID=UPI001323ADCA|nr:TetR/AcrR family transcriptional regulator [Actinophytocola sp.]MPZ83897.1 TetR family transcriptional regulator [Actinophytocola sp.]